MLIPKVSQVDSVLSADGWRPVSRCQYTPNAKSRHVPAGVCGDAGRCKIALIVWPFRISVIF
jgi:hypothetical protein